MNKKEIIEEFEKKFPEDGMVYDGGTKSEFAYQESKRQKIKSFLLKALDQQREEFRKMVKKMKESYGGGLERFEKETGVNLERLVFVYNQALTDILKELDK